MIEVAFDLTALGHTVTSLGRLTSFDHARCDAILQQRYITVVGVYAPGKPPLERDTVYSAFAYLGFWLAVAAVILRESYLPQNRDSCVGQSRYLTPLVIFGTLLCLVSQLHAMADYVDTCTRILKST